jgi:hypothetical protein
MRVLQGLLGVIALVLATPVTGCTALLGDFSATEAVTKEAGTEPDAMAVRDGGSSADGSALADASGSDDASSAGDSSGACASGQIRCAAGCVSANDLHTCGDCNNDCTTLSHVEAAGLACTGGACAFTCSPGYAHCPTSPAGACETNLSAYNHCGSCTTVCAGNTPVCAVSSGSTYACASGCPGGTVECSGSCSDLTSDDSHCGDCGTACTGGMTCQSGKCACPAPLTDCGGTCFETDGDPNHCGASCTVCPVPGNGGTATCSQGNCGVSCQPNYSACGTTTPCAFNTDSDAAHCGPTCVACATGFICSAGACQCPVGRTNCGGVCVNTATDANNCGGCGNVCPVDTDPLCKSSLCSCVALRCGSTACGCGDTCCKIGTTLTCCAAP